MKTSAIFSLLFASALAIPTEGHSKRTECTPIQYRCHPVDGVPAGEGWDVCDVDGTWKYGGACEVGQHCTFNAANGSPYCVDNIDGPCPAGAAVCTPEGIQECIGGQWVISQCPTGTQCAVQGGSAACIDVPNCIPATYRCAPGHNGWEVCTTWGEWVNGGYCQDTEYCKFNWLNGSPYCLPL